MKNFLLILSTLISTAELGLMFYMFSGHYTNNVGIAVLIGLALSIIFFLIYLLQEQREKIQKSRRKPKPYHSSKQTRQPIVNHQPINLN